MVLGIKEIKNSKEGRPIFKKIPEIVDLSNTQFVAYHFLQYDTQVHRIHVRSTKQIGRKKFGVNVPGIKQNRPVIEAKTLRQSMYIPHTKFYLFYFKTQKFLCSPNIVSINCCYQQRNLVTKARITVAGTQCVYIALKSLSSRSRPVTALS